VPSRSAPCTALFVGSTQVLLRIIGSHEESFSESRNTVHPDRTTEGWGMLNRLTDSLDFQGKALQLRAERQQVLAANIANADTPQYQARDVDFRQALAAATDPSKQAAGLVATTTRAAHLPVRVGAGTGAASLLYTQPEQASIDGNTVDLNRERANFADNAIRYEATLRFINSRVRTMLTAIKGE
jgi:flagellar basal-body rod protein FlgB